MQRITILLLMLCAAVLPLQAAVVINELYYDHAVPSSDVGKEFLELYNNGSEAVDLSGWQVQWVGTTWTPPYGYWSFPAGTIIAPGDYFLVGGDSVEIYFDEVPDLIYNFTFQNGGNESDGVRITDEVINPTSPYYDTNLYDSPNTNGLRGDDANPGQQLCPDVDPGHSLERVTLGVDNNLAADWFDNPTPTPHRSAAGVAPYVNWTMNYPVMVGPFSNVQIISEIIDDDGFIASAVAYYSIDGLAWNQVSMINTIGNRWAADLPQQSVGITVQYYVYAEDDDGLSVLDPAGAPANTYSYTVEDLILSPTIAETKTWDENFVPVYIDSFFVIEGYVTATNQFGLAGPASIQDETAGIAVYNANNFNWAGIQVGDYVRVYGWQGFYNGLTEFVDEPTTGTPDPQVYVIGPPSQVEPLVVTPSDFNEELESQLVKLENCQFIMGGNFTGGSSGFNYTVLCDGDSFAFRIDESTNIPGQPIPTGICDLIGVLSQYDPDFTAPYDTGFQVMPRFYSDIIVSGNQPPFIGNVNQTPLIVTPSDEVNITAEIYDDGSIPNAQLWYEIAVDEWVFTQMYDDGLHGDGAAGDSLYGAYIPAQTAGTTVSYYLLATDNIGQTTYQPTGGASTPLTYTVTSGVLVTPIATVRQVDLNGYPINYGNLYIVRGIVTSASQFGYTGPAYLQDATAGICFYDGLVTASGIAIGDSIELTAYVDFYNGLIQFADDPANPNNDPSLIIINSGNPIAYATITPTQLGENFEGQLVRINGATFVQTGNFTSGQTCQACIGSDTFNVYIDNSTNLIGTPIPTGEVDIVGCAGQYDTSSPYTSFYQLLPRFTTDITVSINAPPFIGAVTQTPQTVTPADSVCITAPIYDDGSIQEAQLWYEVTADEWVNEQMYDDGLHGDGAAGDSVYGAHIMPQVVGTVVSYYLLAIDNIGQITYQPAGGASAPLTYTVTPGVIVTPISEVRAVDANGYPVNYGTLFTVRGVVTVAAQYGSTGPAHLQDATAGITLYDALVSSSGIAIGDSIELNAYVDFYYGLIELADDPFNSANDPTLIILNSGNPISYATIAPTEMDEDYEGQLVKIRGAGFAATGNFGSGVNYNAGVGTDTFQVRIDNSTNLVGTPIPTGLVDIIGGVSQYDNSSPYTSGYQLLPRFTSDITPFVPGGNIEDLLITVQGNDVVLSWLSQIGAAGYHIYAIDTPYGAGYEIGTTTNTTFTIADALLSATEKFYYVTYDY